MVERVADCMGKRVFDGLEKTFIQFSFWGLPFYPHRRPRQLQRSRTMRGILEKMFETGCMRAFITPREIGCNHVEPARQHGHTRVGRRGLQHLVTR